MSEDRDLPRDDTGRITIDYEPTPLEIKVCRDAICREFGNNGTDGYYIRILKAVHAASAARPSHTGEKVEAVLASQLTGRADWYNHAHPGAIKTPSLLREAAATIAALVAERDEARASCSHWMAEAKRLLKAGQDAFDHATIAETALAAANARVERLEKALREIREQDRVTRYRGTEQQFYEDGPCGKIARAALTGGENDR